MSKTGKRGQTQTQDIVVWDPLVRLVHWGLALSILLNATIVDDDSKLHIWIGYGAVGLVIIRLIWGWIGPRKARFSAFPPSPTAALKHLMALANGDKVSHLSHNPLGGLMVYNIWATVLVIAGTGYTMGTMLFFGVEWVEEVHEMAFFWLLISISLHIAGVIFETRRTGVNLAKSMVSGKKRVRADRLIK